jgi:hypothetical protein
MTPVKKFLSKLVSPIYMIRTQRVRKVIYRDIKVYYGGNHLNLC